MERASRVAEVMHCTQYRGWRRVKGIGLPGRTRLFYKFSARRKVIVYAWLNDAKTLRKQGDATQTVRQRSQGARSAGAGMAR